MVIHGLANQILINCFMWTNIYLGKQLDHIGEGLMFLTNFFWWSSMVDSLCWCIMSILPRNALEHGPNFNKGL